MNIGRKKRWQEARYEHSFSSVLIFSAMGGVDAGFRERRELTSIMDRWVTGERVLLQPIQGGGKLIDISADGVQISGRAVDNLHPSYLAYVPKQHVGYPVALNAAARWLLMREDLMDGGGYRG